MARNSGIARILVPVMVGISLIPVVRLLADWVRMNRVLDEHTLHVARRSFDWVHWEESEGGIRASYVPPKGPAARGGIQPGDVFFMLDGQQYFNVDDLRHAIEGISPGTTRTYHVQRESEILQADVLFTRYPTFLYPLGAALWHCSVWGFLIAAFIHVIGLVIVVPISTRSRESRFSLLLILASSLWIVGNLLRLLLVELLAPPGIIGGGYDSLFQGLTVLGMIGWVGFPAVLVHRMAEGTGLKAAWFRKCSAGIYLPGAVLGLAALIATVRPGLIPIAVDGLVGPILFYACCYIATAGGLMLIQSMPAEASGEPPIAWSRWGTASMTFLACLLGLSILGIVPVFGFVTEAMAGWLVTGAQLLSVLPVMLVAHATIQHGKLGQVLTRGLTHVTVSGLVFLAFVGGMSLLDPQLERIGASRNVIPGLFVVALLASAEWLTRRLRRSSMRLFAAERRRMIQATQELQHEMQSIIDYETLVQHTIDTIGRAFLTRSTTGFFRPDGDGGTWITSTYHPGTLRLNRSMMASIWPHLGKNGHIWARNRELNELDLPEHVHELLIAHGAAILVPVETRIKDEHFVKGVIILGPKEERRSVHNLEEMDILRSLAVHLGLALERLALIERERALVREMAETRLVALRAQINPHFLFNAFNTLISLIEERPEEAERVVEHLATIFRHVLQTGKHAFVPLEDEFELIHHYLSIERYRFGNALTVEQVMDPKSRSRPVPAFAIQTLVENAVKHGIARRRGGGTIRIESRHLDAEVHVEVSDTGVGIPDLFDDEDATATNRHRFFGIGLRNVSMRLEQLYGRRDLLAIRSAPGQGTTAIIRIPLVAIDESGHAAVLAARPGDGQDESNGYGNTPGEHASPTAQPSDGKRSTPAARIDRG